MDTQTLQFYSANAANLAEKYNSCTDGISAYFAEAFVREDSISSRILDIGCASGRDLRILHELGYQADGIDSCPEFVDNINKNLCQSPITDYRSPITAILDSLPELAKIADNSYDGVLCSAVLMHLPEEELFDASFAIRRVLKEHGRILLSIPLHDETIDPKTKRDTDGRLFNCVAPEQLQLLFERIGFRMLQRWESKDSLNREHRKWATMLFELESATGNRPIDTIESILNKDAKVATYKLALFRAFANIATTNYKLAQWTNDGRVKISTQILAEKWIEYYWPIIESPKNIPQTTGTPIAFRTQLSAIVEYYRNRGGLSAFSLEYRNTQLPVDAEKLCKELIVTLKRTIWNQPVRYAGGGTDFSVFQYDKKDQTVLIGNDIWKELSLMGSWIQDATILRWAEVTAKIAKNEIKPSQVIDCLLTVPIQERDVNAAKSFYDSLKIKECVWSGKNITGKYDLDHAIPFSLWKNNDLWNLLPADSKENGSKKDKLPENKVIKARRDCIINYWTLINTEFPARFEHEAAKLVGIQQFDRTNWENKLFATFAEAVEITAIQRGAERWEPANLAATGTESGIRYAQGDTADHNLIMDSQMKYNPKVAKIAKIVSGGQTGADRGGLDAAIEMGIAHGGWCPKGRLSEDGTIPAKYNLKECGAKAYVKRTEMNVKDSDATVIFTKIPPKGGSKRTAEFALGKAGLTEKSKPCLIVNTEMSKSANIAEIVKWLTNLRNPHRASSGKMGACTLNVAGSRGSKAPGLQEYVKEVMIEVVNKINGFRIENYFIEKTSQNQPLIPFIDLKATATFKEELQDIMSDIKIPDGWLDYKGKFDTDYFIMQVIGDSMEPKIPDGSYCLFRGGTALGGTRDGRNILFFRKEDTGRSKELMIKRYSSKKETDEFGNFKHKTITLTSLNRKHKPEILCDPGEGDIEIVGEFVRVLSEEDFASL